MKSYARLGEQCGSVAEVYVATGREAGSLKEGAHPVPVAPWLSKGSQQLQAPSQSHRTVLPRPHSEG